MFGLPDFGQALAQWAFSVLSAIADFTAGAMLQAVTFASGMAADLGHAIPTSADHTVSGWTMAQATQHASESGIPLSGAFGFVIVAYNALRPLSYTILATVILIEMVREVQRSDRPNASVPYVEKIAWLWIKFWVLKTLVDKSLDITVNVFNLLADVAGTVAAALPDQTMAAKEEVSGAITGSVLQSLGIESADKITGDMFGSIFAMLVVVLLVGFLVSLVLCLQTYVATYARWLQLFVMLPFAPLALALSGLEETRPMAMGYARSMLSAGMAFVITAVILVSMPSTIGPALSDSISGGGAGFLGALPVFGIQVLYIFALRQAGNWARAVIGG